MRFLIFAWLTATALPVAAQGPGPVGLPARHAFRSEFVAMPSAFGDPGRRTKWLEGAGTGAALGLVVGGLVAAVAQARCETLNCGSSLRYVFISTALFGLVGGLIGSTMSKK